jgi:GDP-D-mannose dehydratase
MRSVHRVPRIIILGIGGQDARILAKYFIEDFMEVYGVSRTEVPFENRIAKVNYIVEDLSNANHFQALFKIINPDLVFHLAAIHGSSREMKQVERDLAQEMKKCHVEITRNILDWQTKSQYCKSLIALSSFIYTPQIPRQLITGLTEFQPQGVYGQTKLEALKLIQRYRSTKGVVSLGAILFNHSSSFSKRNFLIPSIASNIERIVQKRKIVEIRNSNALVDISKSEIFCKAFKDLMENEVNQDLIFSSNKLISIRSLYEECIARIDNQLVEFLSFDDEGSNIPSMYGDTSELTAMTKWEGGGDICETILEITELEKKRK